MKHNIVDGNRYRHKDFFFLFIVVCFVLSISFFLSCLKCLKRSANYDAINVLKCLNCFMAY